MMTKARQSKGALGIEVLIETQSVSLVPKETAASWIDIDFPDDMKFVSAGTLKILDRLLKKRCVYFETDNSPEWDLSVRELKSIVEDNGWKMLPDRPYGWVVFYAEDFKVNID